MKRATLVLALALTACNDSDLSRSSIPPIAGIVGGPDQPNGNGNVAMELATGDAHVVQGSTLFVRNLDRPEIDTVHVTVNDTLTAALIRADVGDRLEVSYEHPENGVRDDVLEVQPPLITRIDDNEGGDPGRVRVNGKMRIEGSGFCHTPGCNRIEVDGTFTELELGSEPRPGTLLFSIGTAGTLSVGTHAIRLRVAGAGAGEAYLSNPYEITVLP